VEKDTMYDNRAPSVVYRRVSPFRGLVKMSYYLKIALLFQQKASLKAASGPGKLLFEEAFC